MKAFGLVGFATTACVCFAAGWVKGIVDITGALARNPEEGKALLDRWHENVQKSWDDFKASCKSQ